MGNPLAIATKGKGFFSMLTRAETIAGRYGLTNEKMNHALAQLTGVLQEFGCYATLPVTASAFSRNQVLAQTVRAQGLELAVHGHTHIDYKQLSVDQQKDHFRQTLQIFKKAGISPTGFRCPYLRWNPDTISALVECGFEYDSSQALAWEVVGSRHNDGYTRVLDFYGAQSAAQYPSLPRMEIGLVRMPYCLPDDEALVERLKIPSGQAMAEVWLAVLERTYAAGELFTLGLHPERASLCKDALRAVLAKARLLSPAVWIARLDEIAAWHRSLGRTAFETRPQTNGLRVRFQAPAGAALLARGVVVEAPTKDWAQGYKLVLSSEFCIRGVTRPWIGLAPDTPPELRSFLRHQGYLVEVSVDPQPFSYYLSRRTFQPEDERPLLAELEHGSQPILRMGRWPGGAQAALAVTGDVDAFTLWDYGLRVFNR